MIKTCRTPFLNTHFDNVSFDEAVEVIAEHIDTHVPGCMVSLNTDIMIHLERDLEFRNAYDKADLALMDSTPLMRVAKHRGLAPKEKLSGSDLLPRICEVAARNNWKCFFLGGEEGVADKAVNNLTCRYPGFVSCGTYAPPFGFEKTPDGFQTVLEKIREAEPDILFVCLGTPKSEKLLYPHLQELRVPYILSVGAAIDFCAGTVKRAPVWMQKAGLEWAYRFMQEPRRLFRRYFVDSWNILSILRKYRKDAADVYCN